MKTIVTFDLETTGVDPEKDQICQYYFTKMVDGKTEVLTSLVKPSIPISPGASEVTKIFDREITDEEVLAGYKTVIYSEPFFRHTSMIWKFMDGCIVAGYNSRNYDVPLLSNEFRRNKQPKTADDIYDMPMIDAMVLYRKYRNHKLVSAVKDMCGYDLEGAHDAGADVEGTKDVLHEFYNNIELITDELPEEMDADRRIEVLIKESTPEGCVDFAGKLKLDEDDVIVYNIGKDKGLSVKKHPGFGRWMLMKDFPQQTKKIIREILGEK